MHLPGTDLKLVASFTVSSIKHHFQLPLDQRWLGILKGANWPLVLAVPERFRAGTAVSNVSTLRTCLMCRHG